MTTETLEPLAEVEAATVEVHDVHKWYGTHRVLNGIDLTVRPGEVTVVLGPPAPGSRPCCGSSTTWRSPRSATSASTAS